MHEIEELLNERIESDTHTLTVNQGSAFEDAHPFGMEGNYSDPLNDGRNSCSFFACKISEHVLQTEIKDWADLAKATETIITEFPISLNPLREKDKQYDAFTANDIMMKNGLICNLNLFFSIFQLKTYNTYYLITLLTNYYTLLLQQYHLE